MPPNLQNKYVELHENGDVTFFAEVIDSSGLEGWGFFYNIIGTPKNGNGTDTSGVGTPSNGIFSKTVTGLTPGTKYWVNAYLYESGDYFYHTGAGNTTAPTGIEFVFPDVDTNPNPTNILQTSADLSGNIRDDKINIATHDLNSVGFDIEEKTGGGGYQHLIASIPGGTPYEWTFNVTGLTAATEYTYHAWAYVDSSGTGLPFGISGEVVDFTTIPDEEPEVAEIVQVTFEETGDVTAPIKVKFEGIMDSSGTGILTATELGFFYDISGEPQFGDPSAVSLEDPLIGSVPKSFDSSSNIEPGTDYWVNAYVKGDTIYYSDGSDNVPMGTNYKIPKVSGHTVVITGSSDVSFNAVIDSSGTSGNNRKGFYYFDTSSNGPHYPNNNNGTEVGQSWGGEIGSFDSSVSGLGGATRYWVRAYVSDTSDVRFYTSDNLGDASGVEFYIPKVKTPTPTTITEQTMTVPSNNLDEDPHEYNSIPPIVEKGYYITKWADLPFDSGDKKVVTTSSSKTWDAYTFESLDSGTEYAFQPYATVKTYVGSTSTFEIRGEEPIQNGIGWFKTVDYTKVENCLAEFISSNIKLCGNIINVGSGTEQANQWGFFVDTNSNPGPNADVSLNITGTPIEGEYTYNLNLNSLPGGYTEGATYYFNAYVNDPIGYRYEGNVSSPPLGQFFTIPKVSNGGVKLTSVDTIELSGNLLTLSDISGALPSGAKRGFFISNSQNPSYTNKLFELSENIAVGSFDLSQTLSTNTNYYFNAFALDANGGSYHYQGGLTPPIGVAFTIPDVGQNVTDISGDAVQIDSSHSIVEGFTITDVGTYLWLDGSGVTKIHEQSYTTNSWSIVQGPPIDISDNSLGGNALYHVNSFIKIDGVEISGNPITFNTPDWPTITYIDISRNVGWSDASGHIIMRTYVHDYGSGNAEILENISQIGFYIDDVSKPRSGQNKIVTFNNLTSLGIEVQDSSKNGDFLETGKVYYTNTFVSQKNVPSSPGNSESDNYQYYGLNTNCTTLARYNAGGTFPDGISFIIPKIRNESVTIINASTAQLNLILDSSGHTVDVPGTDTLGFFLNDSSNNCFFGATDVLKIEITAWDKNSGSYNINVDSLERGKVYFYTGYTELNLIDRGEGVDGNDFWYPQGYKFQDSEDIIENFCIGDPSSNPSPGNKTQTTTDLSGVTYGSIPFPTDGKYGFTYWFDGSYNREEKSGTFHGGQSWDVIKLENLHDSTRYHAMPYIKQSGNYIYGDEIVWYTDLKVCDISLNDISGVEIDNGLRYKFSEINISLNTNPPDNFPMEDSSGTVVKLGLCWKPTNEPSLDEATINDFSNNLLNDDIYNNVLPNGKKIYTDASLNIYDASINDLSMNTMYSIRAYVENEPWKDNNLVVGAQQEGGGIAYSLDVSKNWFITPLPAPTMQDTSLNEISESQIGLSGEILTNPDEASGNIIEYGFYTKQYDLSSSFIEDDFDTFNLLSCDISYNFSWFNQIVPYKFDSSLNIPHDLSYNRPYYVGSYSKNISDFYLNHELVVYAKNNGEETYVNFSGNVETKDLSFNTVWPDPKIEIDQLTKPDDLELGDNYSFLNVSLNITNYDPTIWGGIAEFGIIWEKSENMVGPAESDLTIEWMNSHPVGNNMIDGSGGWYRRGDRFSDVGDFVEPKDSSRNGGWYWNNDTNKKMGWQYDASFASSGYWPNSGDIKIGAFRLGLDVYSPCSLISHLHGSESGYGSVQDPSNIPFNTNDSYYIRPYIIVKNHGFWRPETTKIIYGDPKYMNFTFDGPKVTTDFYDMIDWGGKGFSENNGGIWGTANNIGINNADLSGIIIDNPKIGNPPRGYIKKYGFIWWDGGDTVTGGEEKLKWPGKDQGISIFEAKLDSYSSIGFTINNINPPDGSNNYIVNSNEGSNFDISANNPAAGEPYWNPGWNNLNFPSENPSWPSGNLGPEGEDAIIKNMMVIFNKGSSKFINKTIWWRAYAYSKYIDPLDTNIVFEKYSYGEVGRLELNQSSLLGVDMLNPVLIQNNIGSLTIRVEGILLSNADFENNSIIKGYGFCWRKLEEEGLQWNYETEQFDTVNYPYPTIQDSSMVNLGLGGNEDGDLDIMDPSNQSVANFNPSGEFPGEPLNLNFSGQTQNPPIFNFGEREWKFHYNIGTNGEELKNEGGILDPSRVGFDALGGKLDSNTYYLIRAWVKGSPNAGENIEDSGETKSGIKYGPLWFSTLKQNYPESHQKGWLVITKKLEGCSFDSITYYNLTHSSIGLKINLLTNPIPIRLRMYGYVYINEENGNPTINDNYVLLNDTPSPLPFLMDKTIYLIPNRYYTFRAFADNSFEKDGEEEGNIIYSEKISIKTDYCPPPEIKTLSITDIFYKNAKFTGEIISNFYGLISDYGFVWGTSINPKIETNFSKNFGPIKNIGDFNFSPTNLNYGTTYYVRVWAKNEDTSPDFQLIYGNNLVFSTKNPDSPNIGITTQLSKGYDQVTFQSQILDSSGVEIITSFGFCLTTRDVLFSDVQQDPGDNSPHPFDDLTLGNADIILENTNFPGLDIYRNPFIFKSNIKNLQPSTTYYIRSFAKINPIGYGKVFSFTTLDEPCECVIPSTKLIGSNLSSRMRMAEMIKRRGSSILGTQSITPNLPGRK